MEWKELDLEQNIWTLPEGRTKNGLVHVVPLTPAVRAMIDEMQPLTGKTTHVFWTWAVKWNRQKPGPHGVDYITREVSAMRAEDARFAEVPRFTVHDFRRTAATCISEDVEDEAIVKLVLNHRKKGSATPTYDRHTYLGVKRKTLLGWEERLLRTVA